MSHGLMRAGSSKDEATACCHALDTCEAGTRSKRDTCERIVSKRSPWRGASSSTTIFFMIGFEDLDCLKWKRDEGWNLYA